MVTVRNPTPKLSDELYRAMHTVLDSLFSQKDSEGRDISDAFHDLLPKRQYADYYKLIKHPQALNPVQNNVKRKIYSSFSAFVRDCTQIFHNAKLYNRHGSVIYVDAETLEATLRADLTRVKETGVITESDATLPDLGPLPPPSPSGSQGSPDPEEDSTAEEEDEEEEEEEEDEPEEDTGKKRRTSTRRRTLTKASKRDAGSADEGQGGGEGSRQKDLSDPRRKRGRPPRVDTPMEIRVKNVLKALRKLKDESDGRLRISTFEKLPEKKEFPEYFQEIKDPIALDIIRKNVKRREYKTFDHFIADMELMFENAKSFNEDDSDVYGDAVILQEEMRKAAEVEKARKDEDITGGEEGERGNKPTRLPLEKVEHRGETYRVGDWIHIINPNDPNKPTVGQIFRTWKDHEGQIWINACWYYRPEQTVHWAEKKFYADEVVKTGQYRDHHIDEVLSKCFVMFFTRYSRGRPKGVDEKKCPIYVCESRYNEIEKHFNKIKTWKSCIPDEVRGQDYELDTFEKQQVLKKLPSPILHLLPENAEEGDPLPDAKMGVENAPPIIGAVFKRARRDNDSPPPEPTPPPAPMPTPTPVAPPPRVPVNPDYTETMSMTQMYKQAHLAASITPSTAQGNSHSAGSPTPSGHHQSTRTPMTPQYSYSHQQHQGTPTTLHRSHSGSYPSPGSSQMSAQMLAQQQQQQLLLQQQQQQHHHQQQQLQQQHQLQQKQYNPPAPPTTFTLPDSVTSNIPTETANQFLRDAEGRLLWFTVPPLAPEKPAVEGEITGHSLAYLARKEEIEEGKRKRRLVLEEEEKARKKAREEERNKLMKAAEEAMIKALGKLAGQVASGKGEIQISGNGEGQSV